MSVAALQKAKQGPVISINENSPLTEAIALLAEKSIGALPVTGKDGALVGIFSERDVVRILAKSGVSALKDKINAHMTKAPKTCTCDDSIDEVASRMTEGRFRHLPVVDADHKLVDMISIGDVVKHRMRTLEAESAAMRDYILTG